MSRGNVDDLQPTGPIQQEQLPVAGCQKQVGVQGIRIADKPAPMKGAGRRRFVRPLVRGDQGGDARVVGDPVTGGEAGQDVGGARDGLGANHDDVRLLVAVVDGLGGAVGVHGPEVVKLDLTAVDVFPAGVEQPE